MRGIPTGCWTSTGETYPESPLWNVLSVPPAVSTIGTMTETATSFPPALAALYEIDFDFMNGGIDYQPYNEFLPAREATEWFRAWTGNDSVTGDMFRIFGRDGTGGYAAIWAATEGEPLSYQPIVFMGSEGELAVLARNLSDFLWLLADGWGPSEVIHGRRREEPAAGVDAIAARYAAPPKRTASEVTAAAKEGFPEFERVIDELCR